MSGIFLWWRTEWSAADRFNRGAMVVILVLWVVTMTVILWITTKMWWFCLHLLRGVLL